MRGNETRELHESILGQHLPLVVAAHLARVQLVADPLARYDAEHIIEMVEVVAGALVKVAPVFVADTASGAPRELGAAELESAAVAQGGTLLVLRDGRTLTGVSIRRGDLRQAVALLRSVGVPGLERRERERVVARSRDQLQILARIEALIRQPAALGEVSTLLLALARQAKEDRVLSLTIELVTALHQSNDDLVLLTLAQLRTVLHAEAERTKEG